MRVMRASRYMRSTGNSREYPLPPNTWIASSTTQASASLVQTLLIEHSTAKPSMVFRTCASSVRSADSSARSTSPSVRYDMASPMNPRMAMPASFCLINPNSAIGFPN